MELVLTESRKLNVLGRVVSKTSGIFSSIFQLSKGVRAVCIGTMLVGMSTTITYSISPFYMREVLGLSFVAVGIIESTTEALSQLTRLLAGVIIDMTRKKKPLLLLGFVLSAIAKPLFIMANGVGVVAASKIFDRFGNGISATPRDSYVAESAPEDKKGAYLGIMLTLKTFGCMAGPVFLVMLLAICKYIGLEKTSVLSTLLWIGSFPCFIAVYLIFKNMDESKPINANNTGVKKKKKEERFKLSDVLHLPAKYWLFMLVMTLFMGSRMPDGFVLLRLQEMNSPEWFYASASGIYNATAALSCYPMGVLSDKLSRTTVLMLSFLALIVCYACFSYNGGVLGGLIGIILWGVQRGTSQLLSTACIVDIVPNRMLGTALGIFNLIIGGSTMFAGFIGGRIASSSELSIAYRYSTILTIVSLIALGLFSAYLKSEKKKSLLKNVGNEQ